MYAIWSAVLTELTNAMDGWITKLIVDAAYTALECINESPHVSGHVSWHMTLSVDLTIHDDIIRPLWWSEYKSSSTGHVCFGKGKLTFKKFTKLLQMFFQSLFCSRWCPWPINRFPKNPPLGHSSRALQTDGKAISVVKHYTVMVV